MSRWYFKGTVESNMRLGERGVREIQIGLPEMSDSRNVQAAVKALNNSSKVHMAWRHGDTLHVGFIEPYPTYAQALRIVADVMSSA